MTSGISSVILKHRFRLRFLDQLGEELPYGDAITRQVVNTGSFNQNDLGRAEDFFITLEEDEQCLSSKALQELQKNKGFSVAIDYLDGNAFLLKTVMLKHCIVKNICHGSLDYANLSIPDPKLSFKLPMKNGNLIEALKEEPTALAIVTMLNGASVTLEACAKPHTCTAIRVTLGLTFQSVELNFPAL